MPKTLQMLLARYMNAADGEGNDLPGGNHLDDDEYQPGTPEDRGDFLEKDEPGATTSATPAPDAQASGTAAATAPAQAPADGAGQEGGTGDDGPEGRNSGSVPHSRFNEVNERRKEAERLLEQERAENARLRGQQQPSTEASAPKDGAASAKPASEAQPFDMDSKEAEYLEALMEGETEKAMQVRREINAALVEQARSNARAELEQAEAQRSHQSAMKALAEEAETVLKSYPYLNTEEGEVASEMIIERRNALAAKGMAPHLALREAAALIAPRFAPAGSASNTPAKDLKAGAPQADSREAAARTRGAQASVAQPPAPVAGMGNRATGADTADVALMDDEQFDRLSEAEKRRLRGD